MSTAKSVPHRRFDDEEQAGWSDGVIRWAQQMARAGRPIHHPGQTSDGHLLLRVVSDEEARE
jgi:hypothetical protein